jgi:ATP-binding cassette subfamily B protein
VKKNDRDAQTAGEENAIGQSDASVFYATAQLAYKNLTPQLLAKVAGTILISFFVSSLGVMAPFLFKNVIDKLANPSRHQGEYSIVRILVLYILVFACARVLAAIRWTFYGDFEQHLRRRIMLIAFDHIHSQSLEFHNLKSTGKLQQTISNALSGFRIILYSIFTTIIPLGFTLGLISLFLVRLYRMEFLVIVLATSVIYILTLVAGVERQRRLELLANHSFVDAFGRVSDSLLNYETIKIFDAANTIRQTLDGCLQNGQRALIRFYGMKRLTGFLQGVCLASGLACMISLATFRVQQGYIGLGDFVLVNAYLLQLWGPLESIGASYRDIKTGLIHMDQFLNLLKESPKVADSEYAARLPDGPFELRFHNVGFCYIERQQVLHDVTFEIPAGRTVALVGRSGSGKSTLTRLIFRFYDVSSGRIEINGISIQDLTLSSFRSSIAVVPQDIILFNDSLLQNIRLGNLNATFEEVEAAATAAGIHEYIASLPSGYNTIVGERGLKLSGGEKQRIAIARAVLKKPKLFIFDEATSSLDNKTEELIHNNLLRVSQGVSTLIVAHRLSSVTHADEILVLVDGRITERGCHHDLCTRNGSYAAMWNLEQRTGFD